MKNEQKLRNNRKKANNKNVKMAKLYLQHFESLLVKVN